MKKSSISNENIITETTVSSTISTTSKTFPTTKSTPALCSNNLLKTFGDGDKNEADDSGADREGTRPKSALLSKQQKRATNQQSQSLCMRSRSLELNGLALWNKRVNYISLCKGERGLGFSLIDYQQDPFNPLSKTMIVIRALVPNGVAQLDGRLMPGQRLVIKCCF